ncbi:TPA: glycosyltransferase [Pseudomonas aeruginosa]
MSSEENKPLVSFILVSYNQENYIEEAINSVFNQSYENLQIIISDDGSIDHTKNIILEKTKGRDVLFLNNTENKGLIGNLNLAFSYAEGDIIIAMAGDDISMPNRVTKIVESFIKNPDVFCIYSNTIDIDKDSVEIPNSSYGLKYHHKNGEMTVKRHLKENLGILGCSAAFKRCLVTSPLAHFLPSEDKVLTLRALMKGKILFIPEKLVKYRLGTGISNNLNKKNKFEYKKNLRARILTIDGYILELNKNSIFLNEIKDLKIIKDFLTSALNIVETKRISLPKHFFNLKSIDFKDKLRFLYYRFYRD